MRDLLQAIQSRAVEAYEHDLFAPVRLRAHPLTIIAISADATKYRHYIADESLLTDPKLLMVSAIACYPTPGYVPLGEDSGLPFGYVVAEAEGGARVWRIDTEDAHGGQ